jgi:hypothetical protein
MREIVSYELMEVNPSNGREAFIQDESTLVKAQKVLKELREDNKELGFKIVQVIRDTLEEYEPLNNMYSNKKYVIELLVDRVNYQEYLILYNISKEDALNEFNRIKSNYPNKTFRLLETETVTNIIS